MIDARNRREAHDVVAVLANVRRRNVANDLANGDDTVVACEASARYTGVIENSGNPGHAAVAVVTLIWGRNVVNRLTKRVTAVVATRAGPEDFEMINPPSRDPCRRSMTRLTKVARQHVVRGLGRFSNTAAV